MSDNPLTPLINTFTSISRSLQTHLSRFLIAPDSATTDLTVSSLTTNPLHPLSSVSLGTDTPVTAPPIKEKEVKPLTKEEFGRATWTLLHTIAAQYPDQPTRQQRRDAKELMAILSRMYPCKECQDHFKEILKANPVQAGSQEELSQWLCHVHNVVNRSLGKLIFPCQRVNARWGKFDCKDRSCDLDNTSEIDIKL
ncbi:Sulfhydryl oxidase [Rhynchospora pubera]|uniref:Sulfhydryl oxidase n=1 Tax=Rhynchospora pubera TaxID=906938 RepID=A0AAV8FX35_9POAL|nr:Sulfhydryl oxidase [Rhynchospora pubera]